MIFTPRDAPDNAHDTLPVDGYTAAAMALK